MQHCVRRGVRDLDLNADIPWYQCFRVDLAGAGQNPFCLFQIGNFHFLWNPAEIRGHRGIYRQASGQFTQGAQGPGVDRAQVISNGTPVLDHHHVRGQRDLAVGVGVELWDHLVGVDLSPGMLEKARQREQYDELIEGELTEYLGGCSEEFDLMISADTLIYIGDLRSTFAAAAAALRPGGPLVFSVEKMAPGTKETEVEGFRLGASGRYQHTEACIRAWLSESGFSVEEFIEADVRKEGRSGVTGYLVMAIRNVAQ